jgi:hypothetical protein
VADTPTTPPAVPIDIEKPACFYLGREYDLAGRAVHSDKPVMYDARDLTTHGVVVGMTGSGKTGLCIALLEEAAIDGIPSIIIDPKGDLTNLLLQFPDLDPAKFREWISEDDIPRGDDNLPKMTPDQHSREVAERWRKGIVESGQSPERIARLKGSSEWRIFTPGSGAGLPVSLLSMFDAPRGDLAPEDVNQRIDAAASGLLGLTGVTADQVQSREHILISKLLEHEWNAKRNVDLGGLIRLIEKPPLASVGAYSVETFFPAKDRLKFAATLNNVLAAPKFQTWAEGDPLDLTKLFKPGGKPQQLIFYLAHLDDSERMWFTTLLLYEVLAWARKQGGTTNLRALLYFDEVYGYLPPTANPPSKRPLLTLLKQVRAFGVGVLLATQNPIDLDYKALSNAGTWIVGKLQTERDKARLLDGLESVAAEQGQQTTRARLEKMIASLGNRVFLMHDVHRPEDIVFQSRWALSFLRGPMTRDQVAKLMAPLKAAVPAPKAAAAAPVASLACPWCGAALGATLPPTCPKCGQDPSSRPDAAADAPEALPLEFASPQAAKPVRGAASPSSKQPPVLPPDVTQFHVRPAARAVAADTTLIYRPALLGFAEVSFLVDKRTGREHLEHVRLIAEPTTDGHPAEWDEAVTVSGDLDDKPRSADGWQSVPASLDTGKKLKKLEKAFLDHLAGTMKLSLFENRTLKLVSNPGELHPAFLERCRVAADEEKQQALEMERVKFRPKFEALDAKLPDDVKPKAPPKKSGGFFGLFGGSKSDPDQEAPPDPSDKAAMRRYEKLKNLRADYEAKRAEIIEKWKRVGTEATPLQVKAKKTDIRVTHFGLAWLPHWRSVARGKEVLEAAYR